MNNTEKIANNKLILEFMGELPKFNDLIKAYQYSNLPYHAITSENYEEVLTGMADYAKYSNSWDWIIPVIECCAFSCVEGTQGEELYNKIDKALLSLSIDTTYNAVVEFIKYYNTLKP